MGISLFILSLFLYFMIIGSFTVIGLWLVFKKSDIAGWKSLIPFYNKYLICKVGQNKLFKRYLILFFVSFILNIATQLFLIINTVFKKRAILEKELLLSGLSETSYAGKYIDYTHIFTIIIFIFIITNICIGLYLYYLNYKIYADLAKAFGYEKIFAFGLLILFPIFICIIAFDPKAIYQYKDQLTQ